MPGQRSFASNRVLESLNARPQRFAAFAGHRVCAGRVSTRRCFDRRARCGARGHSTGPKREAHNWRVDRRQTDRQKADFRNSGLKSDAPRASMAPVMSAVFAGSYSNIAAPSPGTAAFFPDPARFALPSRTAREARRRRLRPFAENSMWIADQLAPSLVSHQHKMSLER